MAIATLNFFSSSLRKQTAFNIILPEIEGHNGPFPVFYLLHGLSDDYSMWQRKTSIGRYVQMLPLIVVMPDGGRGFYCDAEEGFAYESAIVRDLIPFVDRMFHTVAEKRGRCIGGLSMGGYGALKLALKFPELFASANGHSGAYGFGHGLWRAEETEFARITGPNPIGGPNDCFALAQAALTKLSAWIAARAIFCSTTTARFTSIWTRWESRTSISKRWARTTGTTGTSTFKARCVFTPSIWASPNQKCGLEVVLWERGHPARTGREAAL